jgi:CBS domain-containing protein
MQREVHKPLPMRVLGSPAYCRPPARQPLPTVKADSPALLAMTDLRKVPPATIARGASLHEADRIMRACGVRLLVVVGPEHMIEGLITARDTQGERPVKLLLERRGKYEDLCVEDLMVPLAAIEVLDLATVQHAEVGHVVATLKDVGRQHALVVERGAQGEEQLCGVFSATQIGRQLGMDIAIFDVAHTFAQIAAHLAR